MLTGNSNEERIWNWLTEKGLTPEGTAGLMGNLYAESGLNPVNMQNSAEKRLGMTDEEYTGAVDSGAYSDFIHDSIGYGLCQWTYWSRKQNLLDMAQSRGTSIGDLETQLTCCLDELESMGLLKTLKETRSLQEASDLILLKFERPADQSEAAKARRAAYGKPYLTRFADHTADNTEETDSAGDPGGMEGAAMTEAQLRNKVCTTINGWIGAKKGSATHKKILEIYNGFTPRARGYKMTVNDAWCAATVSATWISCGIAKYTGTECSCSKFIEIAKGKGYWTESDSYMPKVGDAIIYDWEDSGSGENTAAPNHIGIVTKVSGTSFTVTEGNMSGGKVGTRSMKKNGRYIRGFITPNYAAIAAKIAPEPSAPPAQSKPQSHDAAYQVAMKKNSAYNRSWTVKSKDGLNLRWGAGTDHNILTTLPNGTQVRCYGYYNLSKYNNVWLCVTAKGYTGYVDKSYLI